MAPNVSIVKSITLTTRSVSAAPGEEWNRTFGGGKRIKALIQYV